MTLKSNKWVAENIAQRRKVEVSQAGKELFGGCDVAIEGNEKNATLLGLRVGYTRNVMELGPIGK